jgi:hypothetical protein
MRTLRNLPALLLLLAPAALGACAPAARLQAPEGFAVLDDQHEYTYRASTADGVVIAVRAEPNKPAGNLDFWSEAVDRQLRASRYEPDGKPADVRSAAGIPGRQMHYTRVDQGRTYRFWATVFVTEGKIYVVEAGGDADRFKGKTEESVKKAIESLTIS